MPLQGGPSNLPLVPLQNFVVIYVTILFNVPRLNMCMTNDFTVKKLRYFQEFFKKFYFSFFCYLMFPNLVKRGYGHFFLIGFRLPNEKRVDNKGNNTHLSNIVEITMSNCFLSRQLT